MNKKIALFVSVIFAVSVLTACGGTNKKPPIDFAVTEIDITHFKSGHITNWMIDAQENIGYLENWYSNLSLKQKRFKDGKSPGDMDGGEVYSFQLGNADNSFSYVKNGPAQCYILYDVQWYQVNNPADPPINPADEELNEVKLSVDKIVITYSPTETETTLTTIVETGRISQIVSLYEKMAFDNTSKPMGFPRFSIEYHHGGNVVMDWNIDNNQTVSGNKLGLGNHVLTSEPVFEDILGILLDMQ